MVQSISQIPGTVTVTAHMALEHDALGAMLREVASIALSDELRRAVERLDGITRELTRHVWLEETVLFPMFEGGRVGAGSVTLLLRREHRQMEERMAAMRAALIFADLDAFRSQHHGLLEIVEAHEHREESVVFPAIDRIADPVELAILVAELRAFR